MKKQLLASSGKIYALAVGVGLFITVLMVSLIWEKALNDRKKLFDFEAGRVWQDVVQKIERNNEALNSLEALYLASLDVSSDQFRIFTGGIFARHPFVSAAVYLPRVSQVRRAEFERNM